MLPVLIDGPTVEPLTLAEAKTWLRVDGVDEDELIRALIVAARLTVEAEARRLLMDQTWRILLDVWPAFERLALPIAPASSVLAARVFDAAGLPSLVEQGFLELDPASDPPCLVIVAPPPAPGQARGGIEIDVKAGYGPAPTDVPEPLRLAIRLLVARWFENRGDANLPGGPVPDEVARLIRPFQRARL